MRRSLFARLAALSLTVAVVAVAATAWLVTRTTSDRLVGEFTRSLEADAFIYTRLLDHATTHPDWSRVGVLVADLAERTGRRVAVVDASGDVLADSATARRGGVSPSALPAVAAALIDPFAPLQDVADPEALTPLASGTFGSTTAVVIPEVDAERRARARTVADCLRDEGAPATIDDVLAFEESGIRLEAIASIEQLESCRAFDALAPTPAESALLGDIRVTLTACLSEGGVGRVAAQEILERATQGDLPRPSNPLQVDQVPPESRPGPGVPEPLPDGAGAPTGDDTAPSDQDVVDDCVEESYRDVLGPYVADPALLYVETPRDDGLLATAGGGRLVGAVGAVLAVVAGVTLLVGRRLVAPIRALTGAAERMREGERAARVDVRGHDDVARLGSAFNAMAASLDRTEQQRRAMVSDVAHELRSPLTRLRGYLEAAQDGVVALDDAFVSSLLEEAVMVQRLVEDLQQLALADAGRLHVAPQPVDAADLAAQVIGAHRARAASADVDLALDVTGPTHLEADPGRLRQALGNLVTNALSYTPVGGRVEVRIGPGPVPDTLAITVADTGIGIEPEHLPHLFERFYRADPSRSRETGGSGLGLAITRSLVEAHGGTVSVTSTPGEGSEFTITVPRRMPVHAQFAVDTS